MNYIRHLNTFFVYSLTDTRLKPAHISLYMAIFFQWNRYRFKDIFPLHRKILMKHSKIGTRDTYYKCIKELHQAGYIRYHSSGSSFVMPNVTVARLDLQQGGKEASQIDLYTAPDPRNSLPENGTADDCFPDSPCQEKGTAPVPETGQIYKQANVKTINSVPGTPTLDAVMIFFKEQGYPPSEAKKFWYYNESKQWRFGDGQPIRQWAPLAHKWMLSAASPNASSAQDDNTSIDRDKSYDIPL